MRVAVLAVGRLKAGPERDLVARYLERARALGRPLGFGGFDVVEVSESRAGRGPDRKAEEAGALLARAGGGALVALDEGGACPTSRAFAEALARRRAAGRDLAFAIGGADGLGEAVLDRAEERLSLGAMTWPHGLARALLAEQLYRAMTMLAGHPYHRA